MKNLSVPGLVAALSLVTPVAALAQSQADIAAKIISTLPDNQRGAITAAGLRGLMQSLNGARGQPNGIAELGSDGRLRPDQGQTSFTDGTFLGNVSAAGSLSASTALKMGPALPTAPVDLTIAGVYNPNVVMAAHGNRISFCPLASCIRGPGGDATVPAFFDHQRASLLVSGTTQLDGVAQENQLAVTTTIGTGYARPYAPSTVYAVGDNVNVGNATYRAVQAGTTGTNSAPPGSRPASAPFTVTDGGVRWLWINDALINAKVGSYFETEVVDGAGAAWGAAFNYHLKTAPRPGNFFPGVEFDYANDSGVDCVLGGPDCTSIRVGIGGNAFITHGIQITGDGYVRNGVQGKSMVWGLRINGEQSVKQSALEVDTTSEVALGIGHSGIGTSAHSVAAIRDVSTSPRSLLIEAGKNVAAIEDVSTGPTFASIGGTKSLAGIFEHSTTPTGILLQGTYSQSQISGTGWGIDPSGSLTTVGVKATALPTTAGATRGTVCIDTAGVMYVKTTAGACL